MKIGLVELYIMFAVVGLVDWSWMSFMWVALLTIGLVILQTISEVVLKKILKIKYEGVKKKN